MFELIKKSLRDQNPHLSDEQIDTLVNSYIDKHLVFEMGSDEDCAVCSGS
jgi:hypothetical protein